MPILCTLLLQQICPNTLNDLPVEQYQRGVHPWRLLLPETPDFSVFNLKAVCDKASLQVSNCLHQTFQRTCCLLRLAILVLLGLLPTSAAPVNDSFADAIHVFVDQTVPRIVTPIEGILDGATLETDESTNTDLASVNRRGTIWWTFKSEVWARVRVMLAGEPVDIVAAVFEGSKLTQLKTVAPPDPVIRCGGSCFGMGRLEFRVEPGKTYHIAVMPDPNNDTPISRVWGDIEFMEFYYLENDNFANRIELRGTNVTTTGQITASGMEPGEPTDAWGTNQTLWWTWTAPGDGAVRIRSSSENFMPIIRVYHGSAVDALERVISRMFDSNYIYVTEGEVLQICIGGANTWGSYGSFNLSVAFAVPEPPPLNDQYSQRSLIPMVARETTANLHGASREVNEPLGQADSGPGTLWWTVSPTVSGVLQVSAVSELFRTRVTVFRGETLADLQPLSTADSDLLSGTDIRVGVRAGESLQVQVTSVNGFGLAGPLTFTSMFTPHLANDRFEDRIRVDSPSIPWSSGWLFDSTLEPDEPVHGPGASQSVWWSWEAPFRGRLLVTATSASRLAIYTGSSLAHLKRIPAQQRLYPNLNWFSIEAGQVYHFAFWGTADDVLPVGFEATPEPGADCPNDNIANATLLHGYEVGHASNYEATREIGEPVHRPGGPNKSVWWKWQASVSGRCTISLDGSTVLDPTIAVYRGDSPLSLQRVALNEFGQWEGAGRAWYWFAVETSAEDSGEIYIHAGVSLVGIGVVPPVRGNLLTNGSFESPPSFPGFPNNWRSTTPEFGAMVGEWGGVDGGTWIWANPPQRLWQDIPTVPGASYQIQLATRGTVLGATNRVRVWFADQLLGEPTAIPGPTTYPPYWSWNSYIGAAKDSTSRLLIEWVEGVNEVDGITLVQVNDVPSIRRDLFNQLGYSGLPATFAVDAVGTPPLRFEWYLGEQLVQVTDVPFFTISPVRPEDAGSYHVTVSNAFGTAVGSSATLQVLSSDAPILLADPEGGGIVPGQFFALGVNAMGTPPLSYQWYHDSNPIPGASGRSLVLLQVGDDDFGQYHVVVSGPGGVTVSRTAQLFRTATKTGGASIDFRNMTLSGGGKFSAPIYDVDGFTPLSGSNFVAQLYGGHTADSLRPVGNPSPFFAGFRAGFFVPSTVVLPDIEPGDVSFFQVRAWEIASGASYEQARAFGGRFGRSEIMQLVLPGSPAGPPPVPSTLTGLQSFQLQTGVPAFSPGRLEPAGFTDDRAPRWRLRGVAGFRYLIEVQKSSGNWEKLRTLYLPDGTAEFIDPNQPSEQSWYRARLLD